MKHVSILAVEDATMSCVDSAYQVLTRVNDFLRFQGRPPFYNVEIVGLTKTKSLNYGRYTIHADRTIDEVKATDLVLIPLTCAPFDHTVRANLGYVEWIKRTHADGAEVAALCVGSFVLASTGLLDGGTCAVHWASRQDFARMFPAVRIIEESIITDEDGVYTCGGGYSYLNLLLYIIEKHLGREMSVLASKMFEIDIERKTQNPFMIFIGQKRHGDAQVLAIQNYIESDPEALFTIDELSEKVSVGRRTFERRFRRCTGNSVMEYIQRVKVEHAKKLLETSQKTLSEIVYETGYNDINAFRKVFRKYTDLSMADYRRRYT